MFCGLELSTVPETTRFSFSKFHIPNPLQTNPKVLTDLQKSIITGRTTQFELLGCSLVVTSRLLAVADKTHVIMPSIDGMRVAPP